MRYAVAIFVPSFSGPEAVESNGLRHKIRGWQGTRSEAEVIAVSEEDVVIVPFSEFARVEPAVSFEEWFSRRRHVDQIPELEPDKGGYVFDGLWIAETGPQNSYAFHTVVRGEEYEGNDLCRLATMLYNECVSTGLPQAK